MKPSRLSLVPALALLMQVWIADRAASETPRMAAGNDAEFWVSGDFDGDTRADVVVIERGSGLLRVGYGQPGGGFLFYPAASCNGENITWALAAQLTSTTRDQLLVFSPSSNRLQLLGLNSPGSVSKNAIFASGAGPRTGAALDLPGVDNTSALDLVVHGEYSSDPVLAGSLSGVRNISCGFTTIGTTTTLYPLDWATALVPATGQSARAGWLRRESGSSAFELRDVSMSPYILVDDVPGLAANTRYACGEFEAGLLDFVFYVTGQATGAVVRLNPSAMPGGWEFGASVAVSFKSAVDVLSVVRGADGISDLLVVYVNGSADLIGYSGSAGFATPRPLSVGDGMFAVGAVALGQGGFVVLTASSPGGRSESWRDFSLTGGVATLRGQGTLSSASTSAVGANVLVFGSHPFRTTNARLLGSYSIFDWTTALDLHSSPGKVNVTGLRFIDSSTGLGSVQTRTVSEAPIGAMSGLVNQYHPQISLSRETTSVGALPLDVTANPPGGHYGEEVRVSLEANPAGTPVYCRTGSQGAFLLVSSPIIITSNRTIEFYADAGGQRSPVRRESYSFAVPPEELDADGDGVPDFVESSMGLDPTAGADSDGDGFTDLEELLQETDPTDSGDMPASHADLGDQLTVQVTPRPFDYIAGKGSTADIGTELRARDTSGQLLAMRGTGHNIAYPFRATLECRPISPAMALLSVSTPFHFSMTTSATDKVRGREIVAIIPVAESEVTDIGFVYDEADPAAQPQAWIVAARAAYANAARPAVTLNLDILETLRTVLIERSLHAVLLARGEISSDLPVCLTPFRPPDVARDTFVLDDTTLAALATALPTLPNAPAILVRKLAADLFTLIHTGVPDAGVLALRDLTAEIYRISAEFHNAAPGELVLPLDALRHTLTVRALPDRYASRSTWTPAQVLVACNAADAMTNSPSAIRQRATFTLTLVDAGTVDLTLATYAATGTTYALLASDGDRFELPEGWQFHAGTRLTVVAFTDGAAVAGYPSLQVLQTAFDTIVLGGRNDSDGDLLDDAWECFHFGGLHYRFGDDPLHTGYSLGEEFIAKTDPNDPTDLPAGAPVPLEFAPTVITWISPTILRLTTSCPERYANSIELALHHSADLQGFADTGILAVHTGGGIFVADVAISTAPRAFYRFQARLKSPDY